MYADTLKLVVSPHRRPSATQPARLYDLFRRLQAATDPDDASETEQAIWSAWMTPRPGRPADELERATRAMVAADFGIAERILSGLTFAYPDFAEAWNKRATLYYIQRRDDASVASIRRTLELEPRHFGAICGFAEILVAHGERSAAAFAFDAALKLNPHLGDDVRRAAGELISERPRQVH
jgi:tetratricopeptide (TPR) repeat protein